MMGYFNPAWYALIKIIMENIARTELAHRNFMGTNLPGKKIH